MIVCGISDNHGIYEYQDKHPEVDLLIHSGDLFEDDMKQNELEFRTIVYQLQQIFPNARVIIVPGNHDYFLEDCHRKGKLLYREEEVAVLVDREINVSGLRIYGNPRTHLEMAFQGMYLRKDLDLIPGGLDILVTHDTPRTRALRCVDEKFQFPWAGSEKLMEKILEVKPRYHFFGHLHSPCSAIVEDIILFNNSQLKGKKFCPRIQSVSITP